MPAKINNWELLTGFTIQSPEEPNTKLCGETERYPGEPDGSEICTSRIKGKRGVASELVSKVCALADDYRKKKA